MTDLIIRNYEGTQEELLVGYDKRSFYENWLLNEIWEVAFLVKKKSHNLVAFDLINYESFVIWQGQQFVIKEMQHFAVGESVYKHVVATHVYFTIQDGYQYSTITGRRTPAQLLTHIFSAGNRGFSWNLEGTFPSTDKENFGDANYLRLINDVLTDFELAVILDNHRLTFMSKEEFGEKINEPIRFKHNTDDVKFEIDTYALKTQIRGFGAKREDNPEQYVFSPITYTSPESSRWGIRIQEPVRDERYHHADAMQQRLIRELHDYPDISGVVKLKWKTEIKKGDYVPFIYEPLGINTYIQVVGIKTYPAIPNQPPEVILSNTRKSMTKILVNLRQKGVL
ncbi:phage tail protein [Enterococcus faecium]|uniref:phage tail protein n=1 Tax=Enterococcus faecium TaxID=1352 RepID=UPI000F511A7B|nr:phage tail protein [Enterococcus faecium]ROY16662.1 hypothetical protein EGW55_03885 [Enterococcus faecium]HAR1751234.1 hypothetical protein [Enterococcus faecium]